jgi:AmiR/NasT family two-component response regulator
MSYGFAFPTQNGDPASGQRPGQVEALRQQVHQLQNAAASRHEIGIAQGLLMVRHGLDQSQAYAILSRRAQDENVHVRAAAQSVAAELGFTITPTPIRPF